VPAMARLGKHKIIGPATDGAGYPRSKIAVFNAAAVVDAFLSSNDKVLTTNVFVPDPHLVGVGITKSF
jgi:hypothetical protein